jgi:hypothetical protein
MPHGEPRCGNCGTSLISGSFHSCKPAWDEENASLRVEVERLKEEVWQLKASLKAVDESKTEMFHAKESANLQVESFRKALTAIYNHESSQPGVLRAVAFNALNNPDTKKRKGLDGIKMNRDPKWLEKMAKLEGNAPVTAGAWPDVYEPCDRCGAIKPKGEGCLGCAGRKG